MFCCTPSFFSKFSYSLLSLTDPEFFQYHRPSIPRIWMTSRHYDFNITLLIEPRKIRPSVDKSIAGNRSMNCLLVNRKVLQRLGIFLSTVKILCIYCIDFIWEKIWWCITKHYRMQSSQYKKYRGILLPHTCEMNYNMQHNYVNMRLHYVNLQDNFVDMQHNSSCVFIL